MGFEPQTAGKPLVNVHKKTTKVNISMAIGVAIFLILGVIAVVWATQRSERGETVPPPLEAPK
jgi:uncharacterized membrane protein YqjE